MKGKEQKILFALFGWDGEVRRGILVRWMAFGAICYLEAINYISHYGLLRKETAQWLILKSFHSPQLERTPSFH
jgi:hypothetical protein